MSKVCSFLSHANLKWWSSGVGGGCCWLSGGEWTCCWSMLLVVRVVGCPVLFVVRVVSCHVLVVVRVVSCLGGGCLLTIKVTCLSHTI